MAEQNEVPQASSSPSESPTSFVRTLLSIILLLHLFCLAVGVLTNARPVSAVRGALANIPLVLDYLQLVQFDQAYDYPLTQGRPPDGEHRLQLEIAGSSDEVQYFPDDQMWPAIRRHRYQNLAAQIADLAVLFENNPHLQTLLVTSVAKWMLIESNAPAGTHTLRCQQRAPKSMEQFRFSVFSEEAGSPEAYETVIETRLLWDGKDQLLVALSEKENLSASVKAATEEHLDRQPSDKESQDPQ